MKLAAGRMTRRWIWAVLSLALLVRVVLVWNGGQGFWPDETRYQDSQEAVRRLAEGRFWSGLGYAVAGGDHPGFKLLGVVPAVVAKMTGVQDLRLPAAFFTCFSWLALVLLWGCVRRAGASPDVQAWTVTVAAVSTALTFYTRHLLPYDASLALALAALYVGWKEGASQWRTFVAGFLAGMALLVYLGYWLVVGVVVLLLACRHDETWWRRLARWAVAGVGAATVLFGVWLIDRLGERTMLENARRFSGTVTQGDFDVGWRLVWEYLWHTEGLLVVLWLVATGWLAVAAWRLWRGGCRPERVWLLGLMAVAVTYGGLVFFSDAVHKFVVYGRTARQLVPFFAVVSGLVLARWLAGRRGLAWVVGSALLANFAWRMYPVLTVSYPNDFRKQAAAVLARATPAEPGKSYYRLVNVDHYVYEAETLPYAPEETLLAARHPYEFAPYLYEGSSAWQRQQRRAADQRMRLVRMVVPAHLRLADGPHGQVEMKLRFAAGRMGMSEPLLSLGVQGDGDLFFVRYLSDRQLVLGMESVGAAVKLGEPQAYEVGREHTITCFSGSLLPPDAEGLTEAQRLYYANLVSVRFDGKEVLQAMTLPHRINPAEVYAGFNRVQAGSAIGGFTGEILEVRRGGLPPMIENDEEAGAVRLVIQLPAAAAGIPEPLVVVGAPGGATLFYVRVLPGDRIKLGIEVWGIGAWESEELKADSTQPVEILLSGPALFPAPGAAAWKGVAAETMATTLGRLRAWVDGALVLDQPAPTQEPRREPVAYGRNPVGGSLVSDVFTGKLLQVSRLPPAAP